MAVQRNIALDLVEQVKTYLTPDVLQKASIQIGESSGATQKALGGIIPTLLGGLANTASTSDGAQQIARMLDVGKFDGSGLGNIASIFEGGAATSGAITAGRGILDTLFGGKLSGIVDNIARFAGIRPESASSLLAMAAPLVMQVLGKQRSTFGLSAGSLAGLLGEQRGFLSGLLPAGLGSLIGLSGLTSGLSDLGASAAGATSRIRRDVQDTVTESRRKYLIPLAVLALLIIGAFAWFNWPGTTTPIGTTVAKISALQLPGGLSISVPEGSFNFSVANWLASPDTKVPKRFVFDNLNFETGTTQLTPESVPTVNNLVSVLKAYPGTAVALEGYTDNTGDAGANQKLSLDRATAVKQLLVTGGVDDARVSANGFGQESPIAPNDTEQGRAKNRRLELVVVKR